MDEEDQHRMDACADTTCNACNACFTRTTTIEMTPVLTDASHFTCFTSTIVQTLTAEELLQWLPASTTTVEIRSEVRVNTYIVVRGHIYSSVKTQSSMLTQIVVC